MMRRRKRIETVEEAIEALATIGERRGRNKDVGELLRVGDASICVMRTRDKIWKAHHGPVLMLLQHAGYDVNTEKLFGYSAESLLRQSDDEDDEEKVLETAA